MEGRAEPRPVERADALLAGEILATLSKTRVTAFDFSGATHTEPQWFLTDGAHRSSSTFSRGFASDLVGFLSEDPLPGWLPRNLTTPDQAREVYSYAEHDPLLRRDPLGLKGCGPTPTPTGKCIADAHATMMWGLCNLHNDFAGYLGAAVVWGGGGAAAVALCGGGGPGALIGGGAGVVVGILKHHYLDIPAAEAVVRKEYEDRVRKCQAQHCLDAANPVGPCGDVQ